MVYIKVFNLLILLINLVNCSDSGYFKTENDDVSSYNVRVAENRLTAQILAILNHYQKPDPVGIPGAPIPDPMAIPDMAKSISFLKMNLKNQTVYGLSKFRVKHMQMDLLKLSVNTGLQMDAMKVLGNYTLNTIFSSTNGPFTIILKNVFCTGNATLAVEQDGKIKTQDIQLDISFSDMAMNFENLGLMGSAFQGIVNSAPNLVFDSIKPFMLAEAYTKMKNEIDTNLDKMTGNHSFSNSISPLDMAIAEARKQVRTMGYDPFRVRDYNHTIGVFAVQMSNTWITGASSFYRVGNVTVSMIDNVITMGMSVGTQRILGSTQWEIAMGLITRAGHARFSIEEFKVTSEVSQSLDTRKRSQIKELQLELGNIQVRCDGAGTLDYIAELAVNILPNVLRYQIMDAIENPLKMRIQEEMNKFDVEKFIKNNITDIISKGKADFNFDFKFDFNQKI